MSTRWHITAARARRIFDSRGKPTIEVELDTSAASGCGIAPAGASTGSFEAHELRDADGLGVAAACGMFRDTIAPRLIGKDVREQAQIDRLLIELDGTPQKTRLGGNTTIATSLAVLNTAARVAREPLWRWLAGSANVPMPMPEIQIIGGGAHARRRIDLQDIMALPIGASDWGTALDWCARLYRAVGDLLAEQGHSAGVADEGGHWPNVKGNEQALELMTRGIEKAQLAPERDIAISLDVAGTQLYANGSYRLSADAVTCSSGEMVERLAAWTRRYPVVLVEDPCGETDTAGFCAFRRAFTGRGLVIGDDLVVTDASRINEAARAGAIDAALIKPNQAGTVSEARAAFDACLDNRVVPVVSARSGETEDTTLTHLAVGWRAPFVKVGSITRGERTAKWNEGIRIAEHLTNGGRMHTRAELGL